MKSIVPVPLPVYNHAAHPNTAAHSNTEHWPVIYDILVHFLLNVCFPYCDKPKQIYPSQSKAWYQFFVI